MVVNPEQRSNKTGKKRLLSILNKIRKSILDFYVPHETIFKLIKKYKPQKLDKVLTKYSKHSRSAGEIEDQYNELSKYSKRSRCVKEAKNLYNAN